MLGENEDSYVQSYIQTQSMGIACETLLTLQLLERRENGRQLTIAEGGNYGNAGLSIRPRGRPSEMWRHTAWESKRQA